MFRPRTPRSTRRGMTLIVVLLSLTLLAIVGLTALYAAKDQAERARIQGQPVADTSLGDNNGMGPFNYFLGTLIYDDTDSGQGMLDSLRGHSLMATMYSRKIGSTIPWNGIGAFGATNETVTVNGEPAYPRVFFVNHRTFSGMTNTWDPEWSGNHPVGAAPGSGPGQIFIPKNAAYTYPDLNNFFLAVQCPGTGEILVPSFFRPNTPGSFGTLGLNPSNPNWFNATGATQILRPTQFLNPNFPTVPPNADGTYTGDVQNLAGAFGPGGVQRNDSIWIDFGMPAFTLPNGKRVKALIAPLILDLDGRLNLNIHGNVLNGGVSHTSGAGIGPWEVNLQKVLGAEAQAPLGLLGASGRGLPQNRGGITTRAYAPRLPSGMQLPQGSSVPWTGNGGSSPTSLLLPGQGTNPLFAYNPLYTPTYTPPSPGYDSQNLSVPNHPGLYNPTEWGGFPLSDAKLLLAKYGAQPSYYSQLSLGSLAPTSLRGTFGYPPTLIGAGTSDNYRLDPAHANRQMFTDYAYGLDRTGLTPGAGVTQAANSGIGGIDLNRPLAEYRASTVLPLSPTNMAPANTVVGSVTVQQAVADRQQFAMDIFVRLLVSSGLTAPTAPNVVVNANGTVTIAEPPGTAIFTQLRATAQLAANIVDYIDSDDISTAFVWNPINPADPLALLNFATTTDISNRVVFGVEKPRLVVNEAYGEAVNDVTDPTFGAQMGVPPAQPNAKLPAVVRFWLELQNPTNAPYTGGPTTGPLGDGSVKLRYTPATDGVATPYSPYRVDIVRATDGTRAIGTNVANLLRTQGAEAATSPANVVGNFGGVTPDVTFEFTTATAPATVVPSAASASGGIVVLAPSGITAFPNAPVVTPQDQFNPNLAAAATFFNSPVIKGNPFATPGPTADSLTYTTPLTNALGAAGNPAVLTPDLRNHVVALRRLANPYLPPNDPNLTVTGFAYNPAAPLNPYITVDFMDNVPAFDSIYRQVGSNSNRPAKSAANPSTGYDPVTLVPATIQNRASVGKVQPYVNYSGLANALAVNTPPKFAAFPQSLVMYQNPISAAVGVSTVKHTLGRANARVAPAAAAAPTFTTPPASIGTDTIMTPFDWLVHMDRPLINQLELLHVNTGKPHELIYQFEQPNAASPTTLTKFFGSTQYQLTNNAQYAQIYRALDLLRIQPYGQMTAIGGRLAGRININTIQDKRVWDALFDVQPGNGFLQGTGQGDLTQGHVDAMWNALIASRTLNMQARTNASGAQLTDASGNPYLTPIPGATVYDTNSAAGDRPFLPFGAATIPAAGSTLPNGYNAFVGGIGLNDTLFRINPGTGLPWLTVMTGVHPYQQAEAARKILNNTTTVSQSFAVYATVGYFEVTSETPSGIPGAGTFATLGREYYQNVPGDTRQKFFAIVDRSNIGLDPASFAGGSAVQAQAQPFFTTVEANATAGTNSLTVYAPLPPASAVPSVYVNGSPVPITAGMSLVIGSGANQEIVTVTSASVIGNGLSSLTVSVLSPTVSPTLLFNHYAGENVSNIVPGNPGPQSGFDVTQAPYSFVVPHWSRIQ